MNVLLDDKTPEKDLLVTTGIVRPSFVDQTHLKVLLDGPAPRCDRSDGRTRRETGP